MGTIPTTNTRTAGKAVRVVLGVAVLFLLALGSVARADSTICSPGTAAGQCEEPQGLATDFETGRLYVADRGNNRIDVFEPDGTFVMAFGWGVDTKAAKLETCTTASGCQAGIAGSGAGQFSSPTWIAVDNYGPPASRHDVYVGTDNFRVQRFKPSGEFIKALGDAGTGPCQIGKKTDPIAIGPGGTVFVADSYEAAANAFTNRIERFDAEGNCLGEIELFKGTLASVKEFGVDSAGNLYLTASASGGLLRKYDSSGALLYERGNSVEISGQINPLYATEAEGIALDSADNVFVKQRGNQLLEPPPSSASTAFITEYSPSGDVLRRFDYEIGQKLVPSFAVYGSASGDLFVGQGSVFGTNEVKYVFFPPPGPIVMPEACKVKTGTLGNIAATLRAEVNPEGKATTAHFEYVTEEHFQDEGGWASPKVGKTADQLLGPDFVMHEANEEADLEPETEYRCRVVAENAGGETTGLEGSFTSLEPLEIGPTTVSDVGTEEATLNAQVNPLGIETNGFFEYVEEATYLKDIEELGAEHGFDHATRAPKEGLIEFGAGKDFASKPVTVSGLKPGTSYRFRIVATNLFFEEKGEEGLIGPTEYFRTFGAAAEGLPDGRAWELVSPADKNSAEVATEAGGASGVIEDRTIRVQASDSTGEKVTYTSWTSFGETEGAPATSQYMARRTASGWQTENISPLGFQWFITVPPYPGFTPDLSFGALKVLQPSLTPDCPEGFENLYLRDNETGTITCLSPEIPKSNGSTGCNFVFAGSSEDGSRVFFASSNAYGDAPEGRGYSLYEWSEEKGLQVLSVLPGESTPAPSTEVTTFGSNQGLGSAAAETCQVGLTTMRHVISADGRVAYWTYIPDDKTKPSSLLARINGEETIQLDAKVGGGKGGNGNFLAANADGSLAFFTAPGKLNSEAKGAGHLYRYDTVERQLKDLTPGEVTPEVQGVLGASDDGSYLYFVAKGALTGTQEGSAHEEAEEGKDNLYLYRDGEGLRFIGVLAPQDGSDWDSSPKNLRARVSPDGRHLAFLSIESTDLAGYDNTMTEGQHCEYSYNGLNLIGGKLCPQAFVYDADTKALACASCNPTGARPLGPTLLPGWANVYEGPRYLSDDGQRLFFESYDALALGDENGKRDVYEFELPGTGTCSTQSPAFDPRSGGCHYLISGGKSTDETFLVDASADGRDVFFSTRSELVGWDPNTNYDIYDAREGGGFPEPRVRPDCEGEACKPPTTPPPAFTDPPSFEAPIGSPDGKPKKRKHKAKNKKHKHRAKRHGRADHGRGARP